ncbi:Nif-specific regulatory [Gossypium australe]|uniref:Nif-specific regulatory n=1 Tax=Gossypium australe TaxID=47621 RepID=A0A5B6WIX1_9ROSI|nr:Nif-specific regulatory [Gossypium australe]
MMLQVLNLSIEMEKIDYQEELKKERRLVRSLVYEIDYRKEQLSEMEHKYDKTTAALQELVDGLVAKIESKDGSLRDWELRYKEMEHKYDETTAALQGLVDGLVEKIDSKDSSLRDWELRYNETVRQLKGENAVLHRVFAEEIQKERDENLKLKCQLGFRTKLVEDYISHNDNDMERSSLLNEMEVPKENVACQDLVELEKTTSEQIAALKKELEEKSEALKDLEHRYKIGFKLESVKPKTSLVLDVQGLNDFLNNQTNLRVKRMGEIDQKAFEVACSLKFPDEDWRETCAKACSLWQHNVQDPRWHPFKMINIRGNLQEIIDEDDEKLKELRNEYGDTAYEAVSTALMEMNEYNASGRYAVPEVWNKREGRRATMKEIVQYLIEQLKIHKRKRKRRFS